MKETIYKYIGDGASLTNVPARDLTETEAQAFGVKFILASGLYRKDAAPEDKTKETEV